MSNYSDDDYLRLLAKYNHAERQLAAAREPAPPVAQGEYDRLIERLRLPWPPFNVEEIKIHGWLIELLGEGADALAALQATVELIKCQHNALNVDLRAAQARIAELERQLEGRDRFILGEDLWALFVASLPPAPAKGGA